MELRDQSFCLGSCSSLITWEEVGLFYIFVALGLTQTTHVDIETDTFPCFVAGDGKLSTLAVTVLSSSPEENKIWRAGVYRSKGR